MNVLIDLNIVLDVILNRPLWLAESSAVWDAHRKGQIRAHLIATSLTNLFYIARRLVGRDQARQAVRTCLLTFPILAVDDTQLRQADTFPGTDYEDNVQLAVAVANRLDAIVTRDQSGFPGASIPILTPAQLLARLTPTSPPPP